MFGQFFRDLFGIRSEGPTSPAVNPATDLPMISGSTGFDVGGNPFGVNLNDAVGPTVSAGVNPASGLPMLGDSGLDVAGNPYGSDLTSSSFDDHNFVGSSFGGSSFDSDW
jgi:hypothetical protein